MSVELGLGGEIFVRAVHSPSYPGTGAMICFSLHILSFVFFPLGETDDERLRVACLRKHSQRIVWLGYVYYCSRAILDRLFNGAFYV